MTPTERAGIAASRAYWHQVVEPILTARFPGLSYAAGRLGAGSDVLGLDDDVSRDHDWGLRLSLFVPADTVSMVNVELERLLPETFAGRPVRFALTGQPDQRHQVEVTSVSAFVDERLGFDPRAAPTTYDWLSVSGQAALEVVAGPIFASTSDELRSVRGALEWYPDDVWRYVLACDWVRVEQELPLLGRAADVGDDTGSRIITARVVQIVMHLAFMVERRWPPYPKWFGTMFRTIACADHVGEALDSALRADSASGRQLGIAAALDSLLVRQNALGLTATARATVPFWDRPYLHPDPAIVAQLLGGIEDPAVRQLPRGRGSIEQRTDNVDVLVDAGARRSAVAG